MPADKGGLSQEFGEKFSPDPGDHLRAKRPQPMSGSHAPKHAPNCDHEHDHHHVGHSHGVIQALSGQGGPATGRKLLWVATLNLAFAALEIVGGILSGSLALIADALHDLGDALALLLAYGLERSATRGPSLQFSYGRRRHSLLSALLLGVLLVGGSVWVIQAAVTGLFNPKPIASATMMGFAVLGVLVNGASFLWMGVTKGFSERFLKWHLLEDLVGWICVLVGSILIYWTGWLIIDPLLALGLSVWIIHANIKPLWQVLELFLQRAPHNVDTQMLHQTLLELPGVEDVHDIHIWSLDGHRHVASLHILTKLTDFLAVSNLKAMVREKIAMLGEIHVTVEIEFPGESCQSCDPPTD